MVTPHHSDQSTASQRKGKPLQFNFNSSGGAFGFFAGSLEGFVTGDGRGDVDELLPIETDGAGVAAITLHLGQARDKHTASATGRVVDCFARLGFEHLRHQVHERAVGIELLRRVAAVISELLDEVLVGVAKLILRHIGEA